MEQYFIEGNKPISGKVTCGGNKNAALPCIAAALLTDEIVTLRNIPDINDVQVMLDIFRKLGGVVENAGKNVWTLQCGDIGASKVPEKEAHKIRASILFAGPLLARTGKAVLPPPGGDVIGRRRVDTHILALTALGAKVEYLTAQDKQLDPHYCFISERKTLVGADIFLDEASVTATENAVMAASLAKGETTLTNAACEPHVQDLCQLLSQMGARISGIGSNVLRISGVERLHGADFSIGADFMEAGSFIGLAAATNSSLDIEGPTVADMRPAKIGFAKIGVEWEHEGTVIHVSEPKGQRHIRDDFGGQIASIDDAPWPGFPPDLVSIITVAATQVSGTVLIHEKMFESRLYFVDMLIRMGARIVLCDPHRAVVAGPSPLTGSILTSPDVRAGMAMVIAALAASGKSVISNVYQIERGYENIVNRLRGLGADIMRQEL